MLLYVFRGVSFLPNVFGRSKNGVARWNIAN